METLNRRFLISVCTDTYTRQLKLKTPPTDRRAGNYGSKMSGAGPEESMLSRYFVWGT